VPVLVLRTLGRAGLVASGILSKPGTLQRTLLSIGGCAEGAAHLPGA